MLLNADCWGVGRRSCLPLGGRSSKLEPRLPSVSETSQCSIIIMLGKPRRILTRYVCQIAIYNSFSQHLQVDSSLNIQEVASTFELYVKFVVNCEDETLSRAAMTMKILDCKTCLYAT